MNSIKCFLAQLISIFRFDKIIPSVVFIDTIPQGTDDEEQAASVAIISSINQYWGGFIYPTNGVSENEQLHPIAIWRFEEASNASALGKIGILVTEKNDKQFDVQIIPYNGNVDCVKAKAAMLFVLSKEGVYNPFKEKWIEANLIERFLVMRIYKEQNQIKLYLQTTDIILLRGIAAGPTGGGSGIPIKY